MVRSRENRKAGEVNTYSEKRCKQRRKLDRLTDRTLILAQLEEKEPPKALTLYSLGGFLILSTIFMIGMLIGYLI